MIKELVQFTETVLKDVDFSSMGLAPKEGLHVVLKLEQKDGKISIVEEATYVTFSKKVKDLSPLQKKCAAWGQVAWMIDSNKCFDTPIKAIHSCSPYCFAVKRENLEGGEKYLVNQAENKSQVYDRIEGYFNRAKELLEADVDKGIADLFKNVLKDKNRIDRLLRESGCFETLKDAEYVVFYLDLPEEKYLEASKKYLKEKLFNTAEYNVVSEADGELYGTSNYLNGFPTKKPFLSHQSATFDIAGRVSSNEAKMLYEFGELSRRGLFPRPLPLFIFEEERKRAFTLFKAEANAEQKKKFHEIILELLRDFNNELGNYYLLFMQGGEVKDFDFVSKFEYELRADNQAWQVKDLFDTGESFQIDNVFDLQSKVLPPLFNNALVVRRKEKEWLFKYFDDLDPQYCKSHGAFLMAMKYRKAFYDFIYKSKRQLIDGKAIREILMTGILDDIRLDQFKDRRHTESYNIRTKLNLLFGLPIYFSKTPNSTFMAENIIQLREHLDKVARGEAHLETDEQFAFAAGQVIDRIAFESNTGDESYRYLEPFLAQSDAQRLKVAITNFFKRYKHAVFSGRFRNVSAEVLSYPKQGNVKDLSPVILAGVFSKNLLFAEKKTEQDAEVQA